jgi:hypothetical protein
VERLRTAIHRWNTGSKLIFPLNVRIVRSGSRENGWFLHRHHASGGKQRFSIPGLGETLAFFPGNLHITGEMCREAVVTLLRSDPILSDDSSELRTAFVDVIKCFTLPTNLRHISVNSFKKQYLEFLSSDANPPKHMPTQQTYDTFNNSVGRYLKIWLESR